MIDLPDCMYDYRQSIYEDYEECIYKKKDEDKEEDE